MNMKWKKGQSGNPAGRPKGVRNKATIISEALLASAARSLADDLAAKAIAGDRKALRMLATWQETRRLSALSDAGALL